MNNNAQALLSLVSQVVSNSWFNAFIGIGGLVLGVILYYKGKSTKGLIFSTTSSNVISSLSSMIENIEVRYKNNLVDTLTVTKIFIWNPGNSVLNSFDISSLDPIKIDFPSEIYDYQINRVTKPTNQITVEMIDDRSLEFKFDYLGRDDGCVINVVHSSISGERISVRGTIKGLSSPKKIAFSDTNALWSVATTIVTILAITISGLAFNNVINDLSQALPSTTTSVLAGFYFIFVRVIIGLSILVSVVILLLSFRKKRVPKLLAKDVE